MEEIALKDLDTRLQKQIENARKAVDKNPSYAVDILSNILSRHPACLEARKILRQAQQRATKGKAKGLGGLLSKMTSIPLTMGSESKIKKDPAKAIESAEQILNANPENVAGKKSWQLQQKSLSCIRRLFLPTNPCARSTRRIPKILRL